MYLLLLKKHGFKICNLFQNAKFPFFYVNFYLLNACEQKLLSFTLYMKPYLVTADPRISNTCKSSLLSARPIFSQYVQQSSKPFRVGLIPNKYLLRVSILLLNV